MKIISRYFEKQLVAFFIGLLLVLVGLAWMMQVLGMLKFLVQYGIDVWGFLGLTAMMVPFIVSIIIPFALFIAVMFVYSRLIADSEVTVMAACGMSPGTLARPALGLAAIIAVLHLTLNVWIVPSTQAKFYDTQWVMRYGLAHIKLQEAAFTRMTRGLVVYVDKVSDRDLSQLIVSDVRDDKSHIVILADKGKLVSTDRGLSIAMENGSVQIRSETFAIGTFKSFDMDFNINDRDTKQVAKVRRIPTAQLYRAAKTATSAHDRAAYSAELGNRLLGPLMNIILVLIFVNALLKSSLLRRGVSMAPIVAIVGMGSAMAAFMIIGARLQSLFDVAMFALAQTTLIIGLFVYLSGSRK
jgi:lipopolysaccharide export system permease protein